MKLVLRSQYTEEEDRLENIEGYLEGELYYAHSNQLEQAQNTADRAFTMAIKLVTLLAEKGIITSKDIDSLLIDMLGVDYEYSGWRVSGIV